MSPYRTVNYLAYRVSVSTSAARNYAREAGSLAREAFKLEIGGGSDHYALLVPEIQAQAAHAEAAATRAQAALDRCWAEAREDPRGPVIRVSDGAICCFQRMTARAPPSLNLSGMRKPGGRRHTLRWTLSKPSVLKSRVTAISPKTPTHEGTHSRPCGETTSFHFYSTGGGDPYRDDKPQRRKRQGPHRPPKTIWRFSYK